MENLENKNNDYPSYYSITPATVRYDSRLNFGARLLYGEITCLSNKKGYCYANNYYFANLYKTSKGTISEWIKQLKEFGYIDIIYIYKDGTKEIIQRNIYVKDTPLSKNLTTYSENNPTPSENRNTPISKNRKDNITSINNTRDNREEPENSIKEKELDIKSLLSNNTISLDKAISDKNIELIKILILYKIRNLIQEIRECHDLASFPPTFNSNRYLYDNTIRQCLPYLSEKIIDEWIEHKTQWGGFKIGMLNKQLEEYIFNQSLKIDKENKRKKEIEERNKINANRPHLGNTLDAEYYEMKERMRLNSLL